MVVMVFRWLTQMTGEVSDTFVNIVLESVFINFACKMP